VKLRLGKAVIVSVRRRNGEIRVETWTDVMPSPVHASQVVSDDNPKSRHSSAASKNLVGEIQIPALMPGMLPSSGWRNVGRSTPESALQTELWAEERQNVELAASMITFDQNAREMMEALLADLPDSVRDGCDSPERLAALLMTGGGDDTPLVGFRILSSQASGDQLVALRTEWQYADGHVRQNDWQFRRDSDGWKRVLPPIFVDKLIRLLRGRAAQSPRQERRSL
jgi:hypothetical protein